MGSLDIIYHWLNFLAPAAALACLLGLVGLFWRPKRPPVIGWKGRVALNFIAGVMASIGAVWWLGRDGKMIGYALLVLSCSTSQWVLTRGWRV
jgi:hypothetical protein